MTDNRIKLLFGFALLVGFIALAAIFGLGHVEEKTSFGLKEILTGLLVLAGAWAAWALGFNKPKDD